MLRGTTLLIDLEAARHNLAALGSAAPGRKIIAVVKANAYGHGAVGLSRAFIEAGASALAVAFVSEARALREARIKAPVLVLFDRSEIPAFFELGLTPVLHDMKTSREFSDEAARRGTRIGVHVKVDTGMGRMGLEDTSDVLRIAGLPGVVLEGLMSHLSDADLADRTCTDIQIKRFKEVASQVRASGINPLCHIANSAAALSLPESHFDAIRPGLSLYGISPFESSDTYGLRPVMSVRAKILALRRIQKGSTISYGRTFTAKRDTLAAVMAVGYADGYSRAFSNSAHVIINGLRAPVAGRVCMDLTVADVTGISGVSEGDDVVLLGRGGPNEIDETNEITAWELARKAGTIPYETLLSLGRGAGRVEHTA